MNSGSMRLFGDTSAKLRPGVSLVEVLVVIGIVSLLLQLLFPAIQAAREAARRLQCTSHLQRIGLAMNLHHDTHRAYPSGGWHFDWVGEPERGTGPRQPGSWIYNLLVPLEQPELRNAGRAMQGEARYRAIRRRCAQPLPLFHCPSRRVARGYPHRWNRTPYTAGGQVRPPLDTGAKTDYAANAGDGPRCEFDYRWPGPTRLEQGDHPSFHWPSTHEFTGVVFGRSRLRYRQITDGLSRTYLVGEKYLDTRHYTTGEDFGDNENLHAGFNNDNCRTAWTAPRQDQPADFRTSFGSAHRAGWQAVMCDGSVRLSAFDVDRVIHRRLANRRDVSQNLVSSGYTK